MKKMLGLLSLALLVSLPGCGCCKSKGKKEESRAKTTKQTHHRDARMMDDADDLDLDEDEDLNEDADVANATTKEKGKHLGKGKGKHKGHRKHKKGAKSTTAKPAAKK